MRIFELLSALRETGVTVELDGAELLLKGRTNRLSAVQIAALKSNKPALISLLTSAQTDSGTIPPASRSEVVLDGRTFATAPLSFSQKRLWFLDQLSPGNAFYNVPLAVRLAGALNVDALTRSLAALVERHEILRTVFADDDGEAVQRIGKPTAVDVPLCDLSQLPEPERAVELDRAMADEAGRPFDLGRGPLLRALLIKSASDQHHLIITLHHIVADGWSMGVLMQEFAALYTSLAEGREARLPALPIQYADYAVWQQRWLEGERLQCQLAYWTRELDGVAPLLQLPLDRPRPLVQRHRGSSVMTTIPPALTDAARALGQQEQSTLFMLLCATFSAELARCCNQDDFCLGTPNANRSRPEVAGLIGFFVNTQVLRCRVDARASFRELLRQTRKTVLGAFSHQDLPFEQLVDAVRPARDLSHSPVFQVMLVMQNAESGTLALPGLTLHSAGTAGSTAKFDLTLNVTEADGALYCAFEYNTDIFDAETARGLASRFEVLLQAAVAAPDLPLHRLPLMATAEKAKVLDWGRAPGIGEAALPAHRLFEHQVRMAPERQALVAGPNVLSYAQLNARANRLARYLREQGLGTDDIVGLCFDRSVENIVALLATLKAGAAYLPLDPDLPAARLAHMLRGASPALVLTRGALAKALPSGTAVFRVDDDWDRLPDHDDSDLDVAICDAQLAYVIYTSGSTGQPKAALLRHGGLARMVRAQIARLGVTEQDRVLQFASLNFDASVSEIFMALGVGAALCIASRHDMMPGPDLQRTLQAQAVSTVTLPPVALSLMDSTALTGLRILLVAGEACPPALAREWSVGRRLFNAYGPTEATVCASMHEVIHGQGPADLSPPIGSPITDTQLYILDSWGEAVPVGVAGELHIAGDGLARAYLHQPGLSAEKFLPDPFGAPGGRMYRSGDLARWLPNGEVDYLGRSDQQIKLRGFRIEPGEIEAALAAEPGVREALVLLREDVLGDRRLVGYVVTDAATDTTSALPMGGPARQALSPAALRAAIGLSLPDYMVPAHLVVLDAWPLTPSGKIDRRALPAPDVNTSHAAYVAPATDTEVTLAGIWAEVLRLPRVGLLENFFALGGHSLMATQVMARLRTALNVELPLRTLFEAPTVAKMAACIEADAARRAGAPALTALTPIVPITPAPRDRPLPLSFAQQRMWFLDQFESASALYNMPAAVRLHGCLDLAALSSAIAQVVARHEALRTTFGSEGGLPVQVITPHLVLPMRQIDLSHLSGAALDAKAEALVHTEAQTPFDLSQGPLIRTTLARLAPDKHLLLLTLHHIVSDGWSMGVLMRDVAAFYRAHVQGTEPLLPALPVQYADFAHWQRRRLQGEALQAQVDYWTRHLAGAPALLTLPTDRPRPPVQTYRGAMVNFDLISPETAVALHALCRQSGTTLFMLMTAAFNVLLSRYSGQSDVSIGTSVGCREQRETEDLIGFFINTLVLRNRVDPAQPFEDLLAQVREVALAAYAHQDVPFEQLIEALKPERDPSHAPLFQVVLVTQNTPTDSITMPGLVLEPIGTQLGTSKFDLLFNFAEGDTLDRVFFAVEYNTDLFDLATVERMAQHFCGLLDAICADPRALVRDLPMLSAQERWQLFSGWNGVPTGGTLSDAASLAAAPVAGPQTAHGWFEAQVARAPDADALVFDGLTLSYDELNARANRLAHHLREIGVGTDTLVGVCTERGIDMVVALLGVLKAGGAYLPLDPAYPPERLAYIAEDAAVPVIITQARLADTVPYAMFTVVVDGDAQAAISLQPDHNPEPDARAGAGVGGDSLAYAVYTSGSTGLPKGTLLPHHGLCNLMRAQAQALDLGAGQRVLQFASFSFDAATWEIFMALGSGGVLCLASRDALMPGPALQRTLQDLRIGIATLPPVALGTLDAGTLPLLATLVVAGEACPGVLVQTWSAGRRFFNAYGPTETTVCASIYEVLPPQRLAPAQPSVPVHRQTPPIGRPLLNMRLYVLDDQGEPVPVGVPGELYIGGAGLARGYLNRPGLSAERFVPDPFGAPGAQGARMYRSGDRVRWLASGDVEYLGRADQQIKLRGFRMEPGEIEAALTAQPAVREALVMVREDAPGDRRLVAYVLAEDTDGLAGTLREALGKRLPDYMVPAHFVALPDWPLTPNGKIDRKALPPPGNAAGRTTYTAPATAIERSLADIWAQVLQVPQVGIHDNFFDLGGHSLVATQLVARIAADLGVELPLSQVFISPTVAQLAQEIGATRADKALLVPLLPAAVGTPLFFVHPSGGDVFCYAPIVGHLDRTQPVFGLRSAQSAGRGYVPQQFETMCTTYADEITAVAGPGPVRLAGWSLGGTLAFRIAALLEQRGTAVDWLLLLDTPQVDSLQHALPDITLQDVLNTLLDLPDADIASLYGEQFIDLRARVRDTVASEGADAVAAMVASDQAALERLTGLTPTLQQALIDYRDSLNRLARLADQFTPSLLASPAHSLWARQTVDEGADTAAWDGFTADAAANHRAVLPGHHFTFVAGANAASIAEFINTLTRTEAGAPQAQTP